MEIEDWTVSGDDHYSRSSLYHQAALRLFCLTKLNDERT
jgi:hypothetical protein